jgi:hypothetical protein
MKKMFGQQVSLLSRSVRCLSAEQIPVRSQLICVLAPELQYVCGEREIRHE